MGTKYSTTSVSGYNTTPPSDAGAATEENRITWAKIKTKLPDPIKTALESIDTKLVAAFDFGPSSKSANYTTVAGDHLKTISCTAALTVSLMDASAATAGYTVSVSNQSSADVTIGRATSGNTINGTAGDMTLRAKTAATLRVNTSANGYEVIGVSVKELTELARTDGNFIVGDGANFVAESGATARTSLGLGTAATQNTGTSGAVVPLLDAANTWSANQIITSTDAGAAESPLLIVDRNSASPAASDLLADIQFRGRNSGASAFNYATITTKITDPTAASEDAELLLRTAVAGSISARLHIGAGIYTPGATGGDKGANTINASAVYDDNVLLTCYVPEAAEDGAIDLAKWDATVPDRIEGGKVVEVRTHEPARRFAARAAMLLDPKQYAEFWKTNRHLPSLPSPADWEASGKKMSTGVLIQGMWEALECQAVHIEELRARITALEAK